MCLGIPMKVTAIEGAIATVEVEGASTRAGLHLLDDVRIGDYVLVHAGFAIEKLDPATADETIRYFREMAEKGAIADDGTSAIHQ